MLTLVNDPETGHEGTIEMLIKQWLPIDANEANVLTTLGLLHVGLLGHDGLQQLFCHFGISLQNLLANASLGRGFHQVGGDNVVFTGESNN